jgi:serine protease Do
MKTKFSLISASSLIGGLALFPFTSAPAIEPPSETVTPPAALLSENNAEKRAAAIPDQSAFLGIATAEVPDMVADHLGLSDGTGVVIRTVYPGSPAEKAGLKVNDIITSLDDKPIADPEALSSAIRGHKAGDRIMVGLIQKGEAAKAQVTLTAPPSDATAQLESEPLLDGIPKIHADRLRDLIEQNLGAFDPSGQGALPEQQFEDTFRQMRQRMNRALSDQIIPTPGGDGRQFQQNSTIRLMDGEGSVEIKSSEGDTQVKVLGKDNKIVWSGPWNTEADKAAAPKDIRERIERVHSGSGTGFSFRFGRQRGEPDTIDN